MTNAFYLALRSLWFHRGRALTIILCLALTLWLPMTVHLLLDQFRAEIVFRANSTPLVIGAKGSRIDLALQALYFETVAPEQTTMAEANYVQDSGFATPIPVHLNYRTQTVNNSTAPIVGTTIEYFEFRNLRIGQGQGMSILGDCVLGSGLSKKMQLEPGDKILSAPKNAFNLAGDYPLKMNIVGVLAESQSPDDNAVFIDVKTAWIIDGIGHGHQSLESESVDDGVLLNKSDTSVTASAAVLPFTEITPDNLASFHFHGDEDTFPITAVIAVPHSRKDQTLLLGRYASVHTQAAQCVKPADVVEDLLSIVFRVEQLVWISSMLAAAVTALLLCLVLMLSIRLRAAEMQTMHKLGCSRSTVAMLLGSEIFLMTAAGVSLAIIGAWCSHLVAADWLRSWLF
jgi:putative ABC transport system permease protein